MKTLILLALAVIGAQATVVQSPESTDSNVRFSAKAILGVDQNSTLARSNINIGFVGVGDKLLHNSYEIHRATANLLRVDEETYRGGFFVKITAVQVTEVIKNEGARAQIVSGGLGNNRVTVKFSSRLGGGYYYQFKVWGR